MAHTFEELKKKTIDELREIAKGLEHEAFADDLHPGKRAIRLKFELGKGSYATILVKRITELAGDEP